MNLHHTASLRSPQPPESRQLLLARLQAPWQQGLQQLHGLHGLALAADAGGLSLAGSGIRWWHTLLAELPDVVPADAASVEGGSRCLASLAHWPLQPGSLDAVAWQVAAAHDAMLPEMLAQACLALGPDARLLVAVHGDPLDAWCRIAMPWLAEQSLQLRQATWGDSRRLTWLPPRWGRHWSASWQRLLPVTAHWSVQLWQKNTLAPLRSGRRTVPARDAWSPQWLPQASTPNSTRKDMA
ncbi:hypothetical protein [Perlucidibaca piscinae]|uniref:hypothetical protein n=1 Tax=Perlucidibaca piscinae TaxID=392589 RepID=UPI0003B480D3|nr:hypothetical protein [Perlucidibaca piscinae]